MYYGSTDNPPTFKEILDNLLSPQNERAIHESYNEWLDQTAREYFDVSLWGEEEWDAWRELAGEQAY